MWLYSIEPKTAKCIKGYQFLSFAGKYKKIVGYSARFFKNCFQKSSP